MTSPFPARAGGAADAAYAVVPGVRIVLFDDEAVVFNPFSWETHVLNAAATLVLEELSHRPCSPGDVAALLSEALDDSERPDAASHATRLLDELSSLRLITSRADARRRPD